MATTPTGTAQKRFRKSIPETPQFEHPRLEDLLAYAPAAIAVLSGPELRCSYVNEMAVKVTGRKSADQLLGHTLREGFPELEGTGVYEIVDEVARGRQPFSGREFKVPFLQFETATLADRYFDFVCQPMLGRGFERDLHSRNRSDGSRSEPEGARGQPGGIEAGSRSCADWNVGMGWSGRHAQALTGTAWNVRNRSDCGRESN